MARSTREEAKQTRSQILDAALSLFARRGYAGTSLEDISAELGVTRGAIYGHFACKRELFEHVIALSQDPLYDLMAACGGEDGAALDRLERFLRGWFDLLRDNPLHRDAFEVVLNKTEFTEELSSLYNTERRLAKDQIAFLQRTLEAAKIEGSIPPQANAAFAGLMVYTQLMGIAQAWLFDHELFAIDELADAIVGQLLAGIVSAPPAECSV